jgi:hypothetical protein
MLYLLSAAFVHLALLRYVISNVRKYLVHHKEVRDWPKPFGNDYM